MQYKAYSLIAVMFALSGCLAQSQIQSKYMSSQEDCRNSTARSVAGGETARPVTDNQASPIAARFADCMTKEGWHLATPKPVVVANNPPTGSPSTNPSAALGARSSYPQTVNGPPASSYPPQSSYPPNPNATNPNAQNPNTTNNYYYGNRTATTATNNYPPSGSPSVNPSAAAVRAAPVAAAAPVAPVAPVARTAPVAAVAAQPAAAAVARTAPVANAAPVAQAAPVAGVAPVANVAPVAGTAATAATRVPQTTIPTSPDAATYMPGRPAGEAAPFYGTGPGRQF